MHKSEMYSRVWIAVLAARLSLPRFVSSAASDADIALSFYKIREKRGDFEQSQQ